MIACCITGHRPPDIGGYEWKNPLTIAIAWKISETMEKLIDCGVDEFIFGGAIGTDQVSFAVCQKLKETKYPHIRLVLAIPYRCQDAKWFREEDKKKWADQIEFADEVVYVDELEGTDYVIPNIKAGVYHRDKLQKRNEYMVDRAIQDTTSLGLDSPCIIEVWTGKASGTKNCIDYARSKDVGFWEYRINPEEVRKELEQKAKK